MATAFDTLKKHYNLVNYFSAAGIIIGLCFLFAPRFMAAFFGFSDLSDVAAADIRAYYGTMLIGVSIALFWIARTVEGERAALIIIFAFCLGSAAGRLYSYALGLGFFNIHSVLTPIEILVAVLALYSYGNTFKKFDETTPSNPST